MVPQTCNSSTWEAKGGGSQIWDQPGLEDETLSQTNKQNPQTTKTQNQKNFFNNYCPLIISYTVIRAFFLLVSNEKNLVTYLFHYFFSSYYYRCFLSYDGLVISW
jgi:hypothetical protein